MTQIATGSLKRTHPFRSFRKYTKRGRRATWAVSIHLRIEPDQLAALDAWIAGQIHTPSCPEDIRLMLKEKLL